MSLYNADYTRFRKALQRRLDFVPYDIEPVLALNATYTMVYGERSNGKTYAALEYCLYHAYHENAQLVYIRQMDEDIRTGNMKKLFGGMEDNGSISAMTGGEWDGITAYAGELYFYKTELTDDGKEAYTRAPEPIGYAYALNTSNHIKGISTPRVRYIVFDEFISRGGYLRDEFVLFMNLLSTIIRERNNVKIFMLGNTVNPYCPYFKDMGLQHAKELPVGKIELFKYGDSALTVAVEHTEPNAKGKPSDVYFAFDNPKLKMITRGEWEIAIYPHPDHVPEREDIVLSCFIIFDGDTVRLDIIDEPAGPWVHVTPKTGELKFPDDEFVYTPQHDHRYNWRDKITNPRYPFEFLLCELLKDNKWFYATNTAGEVVRNYLMYCGVRLN